MTYKLMVILFLGFRMLTPAAVIRTSSERSLSNKYESPTLKVDSIACLAEDDLSNALQRLSFGGQAEANQARELLLGESRRSLKCRKTLIATIINTIGKTDLDFKRNPTSFYLWRAGAELLGDLKAVEALDLLLSHLDLNNGEFSSSMSHQPALGAVITMGSVAIPKLVDVLEFNPDPNMRRYAVYCISLIRGPAAMHSLKQALRSESDQCVRQFILVSINTFDNKKLATDTVKWFSAFLCKD